MADEVTNEIQDNADTEVVETSEETTNVDDTTSENTDVETSEEKEEVFNPDELDLSSEEDYTIEGYNLGKFKDNINFEDEVIRNNIGTLAKEFKEKGFTQEQIEFLFEKELNYIVPQDKEKTVSEIKKELSEVLTPNEKRNYKAIGNYVKELLQDDPKMSGAYNEIMGNPYIVKLLNKAYLGSLSGKDVNKFRETKEVAEKPLYSIEDIKSKIKNYAANASTVNKEEFKKELKSWIKNSKNPNECMEEFKNYFNW